VLDQAKHLKRSAHRFSGQGRYEVATNQTACSALSLPALGPLHVRNHD
jgi:hypothetical protein